MKPEKLLFILIFVLALTGSALAQVKPLEHGHAHNDYVHSKPLFEALENGFTSIEIDVFLHHGELKVAHVPVGLDDKPTLEELYLAPIAKVIAQNGGSVYKGYSTPVIFMIDFKTGDAETYIRLKEVLAKYERYLTVYKGDSVIRQGAISILISGASPVAQVLQQDSALVTIDGAIHDMNNTANARVITRYSDPWERYFSWKGNGQIPKRQLEKLKALVAKAHALHKQIRFYHIPDKPNAWKVLLAAGVDWINTNELGTYKSYLADKAMSEWKL